MRVLLTGGTGFIGRAAAAALKARGCELTVLCAHEPPVRAEGTQYIVCDLLRTDVKALMKDLRCTHCLHLAWYVEHQDYLTSEKNTLFAEVSRNLAAEFFKAGGQRFAAAGTGYEYGSRCGCSEDELDLEPGSVYAKAKLSVSTYMRELAEEGLGAVSARIFYPIGRGDGAQRLFGGACAAIAAGREFHCGIGTKFAYDLIDVADLGEVLVRTALSDVKGIINLSTGRKLNARVVLQELFSRHGMLDKLIFTNNAAGSSDGYYADGSRLKALLGDYHYKPVMQSLDECIEDMKQRAC